MRALLAFAALGSVWRAWTRRRRPPQWAPSRARLEHATLAVRTLGERGTPVVLLHGLAASGRIWGSTFDQLAQHHRLVVPDLLGYGLSPRPAGDYGPDEHCSAVLACLDELGIAEPITLVGHSMGALLAIHLAAAQPQRVAAVVALAAPLYRDEDEARRYVRRLGWMAGAFILDTPLAHRACQWVCDHRDLAGRLAAATRPDLPGPVARDAVQHTWVSYSGSLQHTLLSATARTELTTLQAPIWLVAGSRDPIAPPELLDGLADNTNVSIEIWDGANHDLPLTEPRRCVDLITRAATPDPSISG